MLSQAFPNGFTIRDEANALTAFAFRNGSLEDLHSGESSPLIKNPKWSRITDTEMKALMIEASEKIARILEKRKSDPKTYRNFVQAYAFMYCRAWKR